MGALWGGARFLLEQVRRARQSSAGEESVEATQGEGIDVESVHIDASSQSAQSHDEALAEKDAEIQRLQRLMAIIGVRQHEEDMRAEEKRKKGEEERTPAAGQGGGAVRRERGRHEKKPAPELRVQRPV